MQAAVATSFHLAVASRRASHVEVARYFPYFIPKLVLHDGREVIKLQELDGIVLLHKTEIKEKLSLKFF